MNLYDVSQTEKISSDYDFKENHHHHHHHHHHATVSTPQFKTKSTVNNINQSKLLPTPTLITNRTLASTTAQSKTQNKSTSESTTMKASSSSNKPQIRGFSVDRTIANNEKKKK